MDKILVVVSGIGAIAFIWWFFFGKRNETVEASAAKGGVNVIVDGGYKPQVIKVKKGEKTTISLLRKDPNSCLEEFILPDFKIKKYLPLGKRVEVEINPPRSGEFSFHCGMNMFHGKVIVE
ncbi:MAG TPA: cupredoxin domain-containing protein [Patescibacteria group bacterium]|nr:cupredoxin domain-containing protein [Patescibacteria group bacterium]